jgi:hypothetical protein
LSRIFTRNAPKITTGLTALSGHPDCSATLVVKVRGPDARGPTFTGQGMEETVQLCRLDQTTPWRNAMRFQPNVDPMLVCGDRLACLPRSTLIGGARHLSRPEAARRRPTRLTEVAGEGARDRTRSGAHRPELTADCA